MKNEMKNEQAVSPVIATILMVAITVVLAGVLYVWANSLASDQPESGTRNTIDANDAAASVSAATDDTLMKMSFGYAEEDLNWAFVSVKLEIGDNTYDCATDTSEECTISEEDADGVWSQNEHITLSENGVDIMNSAGEVNIYVKYRSSTVAGDSSVAVA